jgi:hypothetical protein
MSQVNDVDEAQEAIVEEDGIFEFFSKKYPTT